MASCNAQLSIYFLVMLCRFINIMNGSAIKGLYSLTCTQVQGKVTGSRIAVSCNMYIFNFNR